MQTALGKCWILTTSALNRPFRFLFQYRKYIRSIFFLRLRKSAVALLVELFLPHANQTRNIGQLARSHAVCTYRTKCHPRKTKQIIFISPADGWPCDSRESRGLSIYHATFCPPRPSSLPPARNGRRRRPITKQILLKRQILRGALVPLHNNSRNKQSVSRYLRL